MYLRFVIILWLLCSFLAFGTTLGNFTRNFPQYRHIGFALFVALFGPCGFVASLMSSKKPIMFRLIPLNKEQRESYSYFD